MDLSLYTNYFIPAGISLLIFLGSLIAYWLFFTLFPKVFNRESIALRFLKGTRQSLLFLLLLFAAFLSFNLFTLPPNIEGTISHVLLICMIAAFGFLLASLCKTGYLRLKEKYETDSFFDLSKRSVMTQVQFLYRTIMLGIVLLSFSSILMTFPSIKSLGVGILGSAGIAGIALGVAARPILLNFMASFQIAMTKTIKIGDSVVIAGGEGRVERINLTHVILKTSDLKRIVVPISYFIDNTFQNLSISSTDLYAQAFIYCDYKADVEKMRRKVGMILEETSLWDKKSWTFLLTDTTEKTIQLKATMSAKDVSDAYMLGCYVREKLMDYIQKEYPEALPQIRLEKKG